MLEPLKRMDSTTRFFFLVFVWLGGYFLTMLALSLASGQHIAKLMMNFYTDAGVYLNVAALLLASGTAFVASLLASEPGRKLFKEITQVLGPDEKKALEQIKEAKKLTQDSLRFRLDWSKAKVSAVLTQLDRKKLVVRERSGKTYVVYLSKFFAEQPKTVQDGLMDNEQ